MKQVEEIKAIIVRSNCENQEKLLRQLDLIAQLPGAHNEAVFDKLLVFAEHDVTLIEVFVDQFIKTTKKIIQE